MCYCFAVSGDKSAECRPMRPGDPESAKGKAPRRAARGRAAARPGHESGSTQKHKNEVGSSSHRSNLCDPCARVSPCVPCLPRPPLPPVSNPLFRPETSDALFVAHFCTPVYILSGQSQCRSTGCRVSRVYVHKGAAKFADETYLPPTLPCAIWLSVCQPRKARQWRSSKDWGTASTARA